MVKNNEIPIEVNKKPFETVYEIKDEYKIPSYEEFIENYQESNLNYDDLSGGSIGEVEGYGPCSDYRCYGSNGCMKDSSGNVIEFFYPLYTSCPAEGCRGERKQTYWVHAKDGCGYSRDKISNKFRIRCPDCFNTSHIKHHRFQCPAHREGVHKDTFWYTSNFSFAKAFAMVHCNREIPTQVYLQMVEDLREQENDWEAPSNY